MFITMTFETEQLYLFGVIPWDGTFVAACIAGLVAMLSWFFTHRQLGEQNKVLEAQTQRQHWTTRYQIAVEHLGHRSNTVRFAGLASLRKLAKEDEAREDDRDLAQLVVARFLTTWKG